MNSSGGEMEAVRHEKRMEERNKRVVVREERKAKVEKENAEKEAAAARRKELYEKAVKSMQKTLKEMEEDRREPWERFRAHWIEECGTCGVFGKFEDNTGIPPMRLTFSGYEAGYPMDTLQFFSVKVARIDTSLHRPLDVYGFIAVRDILDRKRNMIFCCDRDNCQTINQQDPYLALIGHSRAIVVSGDPSYFEVKLKVKGTAESEDKDFSLFASTYVSHSSKSIFTSKLSTLEMSFKELFYSVEATVSVDIIEGSWRDGFLGEFSASTDSLPNMKVNLLNDKLPVDVDGKIQLTRKVVSAELREFLRISIMARRVKGKPLSREAVFEPKRSGTSSSSKIKIGSCFMQVTVGWSLFAFGA